MRILKTFLIVPGVAPTTNVRLVSHSGLNGPLVLIGCQGCNGVDAQVTGISSACGGEHTWPIVALLLEWLFGNGLIISLLSSPLAGLLTRSSDRLPVVFTDRAVSVNGDRGAELLADLSTRAEDV